MTTPAYIQSARQRRYDSMTPVEERRVASDADWLEPRERRDDRDEIDVGLWENMEDGDEEE